MKEKYFGLGVVSTVLLIAFLGGLFFLGRVSVKTEVVDNAENPNAVTPTPVKTAEAKGKTDENLHLIIETSVKEKKYVALLTFMTDTVNVRIESSSCCPPMKRLNAIKQLEYLDEAKGDWVFDEEDPVIMNLSENNPEFYSNAVIGVTSDFYGVSFQTDENGLIKTISMTNNYKRLSK